MIQIESANIFTKTFSNFREHQNIFDIAKQCRKQVKSNIFRMIHLKVREIILRFSYFEKSYYRENSEDSRTEWKEDEKKMLLCFLVAFCRLYFRIVSEITESEWNQISEAFGSKDILLMKYEGRILQKSSKRVCWEGEQELLLQSCIENQMAGKWAQVSRYLFYESKGRFSKTPKQCRQHWLNHMDKQIKRGRWTIEQDLVILQSVLDYGRKWARIVDLLDGKRTEHMIKNRYHSILTAFLKKAKGNKNRINQRRIIVNLMKKLTRKAKMTIDYKKIPLKQLSSYSLLQNQQQQQIIPQVKYQQSFSEQAIKFQPPSYQEVILPEKIQQISQQNNLPANIGETTTFFYPIGPFAFSVALDPAFYKANSFFGYPIIINYNDMFYNI